VSQKTQKDRTETNDGDIIGLPVGVQVKTSDSDSHFNRSNPSHTASNTGKGARELALRQAQLSIFGRPDHQFESFSSDVASMPVQEMPQVRWDLSSYFA
jgi:hypothetical protein